MTDEKRVTPMPSAAGEDQQLWVEHDRQCLASDPHNRHYCTIERGHPGAHVACDPMFGNAGVLAAWPAEALRGPSEERECNCDVYRDEIARLQSIVEHRCKNWCGFGRPHQGSCVMGEPGATEAAAGSSREEGATIPFPHGEALENAARAFQTFRALVEEAIRALVLVLPPEPRVEDLQKAIAARDEAISFLDERLYEVQVESARRRAAGREWKAAAKRYRKARAESFALFQQYRRMYRTATGELPRDDAFRDGWFDGVRDALTAIREPEVAAVPHGSTGKALCVERIERMLDCPGLPPRPCVCDTETGVRCLFHLNRPPCTLPPPGRECSRGFHADGPCAARPAKKA